MDQNYERSVYNLKVGEKLAMRGQGKGLRYGLYVLWSIFLLSSVACAWCCGWSNWPVYDEDLTADYTLVAPDLKEQAAIQGRTGQCVGPMVFAYGWNDDFIIAKQHPNPSESDQVNTTVTYWFIIEIATEKIHGPLSEQEYTALRDVLGIPESLTFTRTIEP